MEELSYFLNAWVLGGLFLIYVLKHSILFVPQNTAFVIERFGKYNKTTTAGLNFIFPVIDKIAYRRTLKEQAVDVNSQTAITSDNITLTIDGVLYMKVLDPYRASYGIDNYSYAVTQLAQTTLRAEMGKLTLDRTFEERDALNTSIVNSINDAAEPWGVQVMRYELKDIIPPSSVLEAMERAMRAERDKRAAILESEGERQSAINIAEGNKQAVVLAAEADKEEAILTAEGEATAIVRVAQAKAAALKVIGEQVSTPAGQQAMQLDLATGAIAAKNAIAKESTVVLMEGTQSSAGSMVAEALAITTAMNANHQSAKES